MPRALLAFYISCFFAFVSGHIMNYTIVMYSQDVIGSDLLSGIGFGLCFGPPIILGWFAGVYCDRLSPSKIIVYSQLTFIFAALVLFSGNALAVASWAKVACVVAAGFLTGCGWAFVAPARFAALGQLASQEKMHGATVMLNTLTMVGFGLAPLIIGKVFELYAWPGVIVSVMLGFSVATVLIFCSPTSKTDKPHLPIIEEIKVGMGAVVQKPLLLQLLLSAIVFLTVMGPMQVLLPRIATEQLMLSDVDRGVYLSILALALILGGAVCMALKDKLHVGKTILFGSMITALGIMLISRIDDVYLSGAVSLFTGIVAGTVASLVVAGLQHETSIEVRGRVMSMYTITSQVMPAVGGLSAGVASELFGPADGLMFCACLIMLAMLLNALKLKQIAAYQNC